MSSVEIIDESSRSCRVTVPASQLSLAIGNKGQNARLAARLTGWKIDIRSEEEMRAEAEAAEKEYDEDAEDDEVLFEDEIEEAPEAEEAEKKEE